VFLSFGLRGFHGRRSGWLLILNRPGCAAIGEQSATSFRSQIL
jgi:hypothetical protein